MRLLHIGRNRNAMGINWAKTNGRIQHGFIRLHRAKNNVRGRSWKHLKEDFEVSA